MDWNMPVIEAQEARTLADRETVLFIDVRRDKAAYEAEHLPGAVNFAPYDYFITDSRESHLQGTLLEIAEMFRAQGVTRDAPVIFYDEETGALSARTCWFLHFIGHPRTAVLHGGLRDWKAAGGAVESGIVRPKSGPRLRVRMRREAIATVDDVIAGMARSDTVVLDVRNNDEFEGRLNDASGCDECDRMGHIPGAVWVEYSELMQGRYRMRPRDEVIARLARAGVTLDKAIIPY